MIKQLTIMLCLLVFFAINASSSNTLQQVPGTGIFMQTPQGFTASKRFAGFEQVDTMSSLMRPLIPISEPTRLRRISFAFFCLKKKTKKSQVPRSCIISN